MSIKAIFAGVGLLIAVSPLHAVSLKDNGITLSAAVSFEDTAISAKSDQDANDSDLIMGVALSAEKRFENKVGIVAGMASGISLNESFGNALFCDEDDPDENCERDIVSYHFSLKTSYLFELSDRFSIVPAIGVGYQYIKADEPSDTLESEFGGEASLKLRVKTRSMYLIADVGKFKSSNIDNNFYRLGIDFPL